MVYKGWTIIKGKKPLPHGMEVSGWIISNGIRETIAESKELAIRYIDNMEDRKA